MKLAMDRFHDFVKEESLVMRRGVRVRMWGRPELLPPSVQVAAARVVEATCNNNNVRLNVCLAYSGVEEMASAARAVAEEVASGRLKQADVDAELLTKASFLGDDVEPELLIRTSGEARLSDFLMLHLADTKLCFLDVLWPELSLWNVLGVVLEWQWSNPLASS